jgi:hypothetical protein
MEAPSLGAGPAELPLSLRDSQLVLAREHRRGGLLSFGNPLIASLSGA